MTCAELPDSAAAMCCVRGRYSTHDIDDRTIHLTNYSVNKHSSKFVRSEATLDSDDADSSGSKWTLSAYRRRLVQRLGPEAARRAWVEVDDLVVKSLLAVEPTVSRATEASVPSVGHGEPNAQCFQFFGFDVLFDESIKPWLLEVRAPAASEHFGCQYASGWH